MLDMQYFEEVSKYFTLEYKCRSASTIKVVIVNLIYYGKETLIIHVLSVLSQVIII